MILSLFSQLCLVSPLLLFSSFRPVSQFFFTLGSSPTLFLLSAPLPLFSFSQPLFHSCVPLDLFPRTLLFIWASLSLFSSFSHFPLLLGSSPNLLTNHPLGPCPTFLNLLAPLSLFSSSRLLSKFSLLLGPSPTLFFISAPLPIYCSSRPLSHSSLSLGYTPNFLFLSAPLPHFSSYLCN